MKKIFIFFIMALSVVFSFTSCGDEAVDVDSINKQTILVFMPWTGDMFNTELTAFFKNNIDSISNGIIDKKGLSNTRVLVFFSESYNKSSLYELRYNEADKSVSQVPIKQYEGSSYATAEGIAGVINDVKANAEALNYAMIIGGHGCGWTYSSDWESYPYNAKPFDGWNGSSDASGAKQINGATSAGNNGASSAGNSGVSPAGVSFGSASDGSSFSGIQYGSDPNLPLTRFFGSLRLKENAMDVSTLAEGIKMSGIKMQYIVFDACYMGNVETAYELKDVTNYVIGSSSEIMAAGIPYRTIWSYLNSATPNYSSIVSGVINFYKSSESPYCSLAAIDCRELDGLASIMKTINSESKLDESIELDSIQSFDGYSPHLFYDLKEYVDSLHPNAVVKDNFTNQLQKVVKAEAHTDQVATALGVIPKLKYITIKNYCGLSISDPSEHPVAIRGREKTAWWKATHE